MIEKSVTKCIVCLKKANSFSGHLVKRFRNSLKIEIIIAGFCSKHRKLKCPNRFKRQGCYGFYKKCYGLEKEYLT